MPFSLSTRGAEDTNVDQEGDLANDTCLSDEGAL
jgi:hypothetical protein